VFAADFTDPVHARVIDLSVAGLLVLAGVVLVATVVWWRSTRGEHPALSRLEVMGFRRYRLADVDGRDAVLDAVRPVGTSDGDLVVEATALAVDEVAGSFDEAVAEGDVSVAEAAATALPPPASPAGVDEFLHDFADLLPADEAEAQSGDQPESQPGDQPAPEVP
jgi:hypothetical protein